MAHNLSIDLRQHRRLRTVSKYQSITGRSGLATANGSVCSVKGKKVKVHTLDIAPLRSESPPQKRSGMTCSQWISQFYLHTHTFIRNRNESYLPLPSQPQLVLIYRPRRDGRLSRPWREVAQTEIRTRNRPIANPALYHTATSAIALHVSKQM